MADNGASGVGRGAKDAGPQLPQQLATAGSPSVPSPRAHCDGDLSVRSGPGPGQRVRKWPSPPCGAGEGQVASVALPSLFPAMLEPPSPRQLRRACSVSKHALPSE